VKPLPTASTSIEYGIGANFTLSVKLPFQEHDLVAQQENLCVLLAAADRQQPQGHERVGDSQVCKTKQHR
jgi:hypothetical protein